jgi:tetratricopeptide (TPR) repeat protein
LARLSAPELLQHGMRQHQAGRLDQAEAAYRQALALAPQSADGLHLLGVIAYQRGRHDQAIELIRAAIRFQAERGQYHGNLGLALQALARLDEAAASYREALRLDPTFVQGFNNLGNILRKTRQFTEAEQAYRRALALRPDQAVIWNNLATALRGQLRLAEAETAYRRAIDLDPDLAEAHFGLGHVLFERHQPEQAEAQYLRALSIEPAHAMAHFNLSNVLLQSGRLEEGWAEFEWRTVAHGAERRDIAAPLWDGGVLGQGTLLVHAEQGLGDTLQFCRYLPLVAARARLVVEVQPPLRRLMAGLAGIADIVVQGEALPPFAAHCPMMSLPRLFGTVLETIPAEIPYLAADPAAVASWRSRLAALPGRRVGLVWAGGARPDPELAAVDGRRSIDLARLAPLAAVPGVSFVSLQKGPPAAQAATPPAGMRLLDFTEELDDFADTAALVEALDLVISVDTSVLHLAGALGKPVWLLNRFDSCWRWLQDRDDSPWYPTLRQFRQTAPGDWDGVVASVATALRQLVTAA